MRGVEGAGWLQDNCCSFRSLTWPRAVSVSGGSGGGADRTPDDVYIIPRGRIRPEARRDQQVEAAAELRVWSRRVAS